MIYIWQVRKRITIQFWTLTQREVIIIHKLVKKAQKGDEKAYITLFEKYEMDIYRMAVNDERDIFLDDFENMEGYIVTANNAEIISYEEFLVKYDYQESETDPLFEEGDMTFPEMVYDLHLTIKNTNLTEEPNEHKGINFLNYRLTGTDFLLQISDPLYMIANPDLETEIFEGFRLRPDSEMDFHLPFYFAPSSIMERIQVEDILNDDVYLAVSLYPNQKQILIE